MNQDGPFVQKRQEEPLRLIPGMPKGSSEVRADLTIGVVLSIRSSWFPELPL